MSDVGRPRVDRVNVTCASCSAKIERYKWQVEKNTSGSFYCSKVCQNLKGSKPRKGSAVPCTQCGVVTYRRPSSVRSKNFCSTSCHNLYQARSQVQFACEHCGSDFWVSPSALKFNKNKFCSNQCKHDARATPVGTRKMTGDGYVTVYQPASQSAQATGWVLEHRYVMEVHLGRKLYPKETVHHKNGHTDDNRLSNLELWTSSHPSGQRVEDKVAWALELLKLYAPDKLRRKPYRRLRP